MYNASLQYSEILYSRRISSDIEVFANTPINDLTGKPFIKLYAWCKIWLQQLDAISLGMACQVGKVNPGLVGQHAEARILFLLELESKMCKSVE